MVLRFFLLAAIFLLDSCTDFERNNPDDTGSINYVSDQLSSSAEGGALPSSSSESSSSSVVPVVPSSSSVRAQHMLIPGVPVTYGNETYQTVVIGSQTWMARNLNYDVPDNDTDVCYNCAGYGRLYNWATAMGIDARYNKEKWDYDNTKIDEKHKGICPNEWHIPSDADWNALINAVGGAGTAGKNLKATSGWQYESGYDTFGFSALPGGTGDSDGYLYYAGSNGYWWSASEKSAYNASYWAMGSTEKEKVYWEYNGKDNLFSIRCVKD